MSATSSNIVVYRLKMHPSQLKSIYWKRQKMFINCTLFFCICHFPIWKLNEMKILSRKLRAQLTNRLALENLSFPFSMTQCVIFLCFPPDFCLLLKQHSDNTAEKCKFLSFATYLEISIFTKQRKFKLFLTPSKVYLNSLTLHFIIFARLKIKVFYAVRRNANLIKFK